jgi:hypothetical protein
MWNSVERVTFSNIAATPAPFTLRGGAYGVMVNGTFGTVTLQRLSLDGTSYITVLTAFTAAGYASVNLPAGTYQLLLATASGIYADIVGIVTTL